jgi:lipoprotein-releasing system permease protein
VYFSDAKTGELPFENFISRKLLRSELQNKKVSRPIVWISVISIALAIVVNLLTIGIVSGFQNEVSQKVSGFGSHIVVTATGENGIYECAPIHKEQEFISDLRDDGNIASIAYVAYKPVLFQSEKKERFIQTNRSVSSYMHQEISGAILKGIDENYNLSFFKKNLIEGRIPKFHRTEISYEILLSEQVARDLHLKLNDHVRAFFVKNQPVKRIFKLVGIYRSGLEEFDRKIALGDIKCVQQLNDWGIQAQIEVSDTLADQSLIIRALANGGNGNYLYNWGNGYDRYSGFTICPNKDTTIKVIVSDFQSGLAIKNEPLSVPDTATLAISVNGNKQASCQFETDQSGNIRKEYKEGIVNAFSIDAGKKILHFRSQPGKGSSCNYVGGFELTVKDWNHLEELTERIKRKIALLPNEHNENLSVRSIREEQEEIFVWLGFLDLNVFIILVLMILIGIINMGSALLVMILVRSNFIGLMKALGAQDWSIRKIFLYQAGWLILRGMVIGNIVGLGLCFIQKQTGLIKLDPEVYYLDSVPVSLNLIPVLLLNVGTLLVCLSALIIPSIVIMRVSPVKAIRFN